MTNAAEPDPPPPVEPTPAKPPKPAYVKQPGLRLRAVARDRKNIQPVEALGLPRTRAADIYHSLLIIAWPRLLLLALLAYVSLNFVFALLYLAGGDCIANAKPGSLTDAFFFSVQTFATIGYGAMAPATVYAHFVVTLEALVGMLAVALTTGLLFTKFSRPTARVLFADVAVINRRDGVPTLQFRMANQRGNQIVEAKVSAAIARTERTLEGEMLRRFYDLKMVRANTMIFALTWTAMHEINESSPLYGLDAQDLVDGNMEIVVSLIGTDETMNQTIHARWSYAGDELRWNHRYVDILALSDAGRRTIDYTKFHETVALK